MTFLKPMNYRAQQESNWDLCLQEDFVKKNSFFSNETEHNQTPIYFISIADVDYNLAKRFVYAFKCSYILNKYDLFTIKNKDFDQRFQIMYKKSKSSQSKNTSYKETYFMVFQKQDQYMVPVGLFKYYNFENKKDLGFFFAVKGSEQGKGIGSQMIQTFLNEIQNIKKNPNHLLFQDFKPVTTISTTVHRDNKPSNKIMKKFFKLCRSGYLFEFDCGNEYQYIIPTL